MHGEKACLSGRVPERYQQIAPNNFWTLIARCYRDAMKESQARADVWRGRG